MGLIPNAREAVKYVRAFGTEPELNTDQPAWVIQMKGRVSLANSWADDPFCVVVDGEANIFAAGVYGEGDRSISPTVTAAAPQFLLPPLTP